MAKMEPDIFKGKIYFGRWMHYCLEDTKHWQPDLHQWCDDRYIDEESIDYQDLLEYFVWHLGPGYADYMMEERVKARFRQIFRWRSVDIDDPNKARKLPGVPQREVMAAIWKSGFLWRMDFGVVRRIGQSIDDDFYLMQVQSGFVDPLVDMPKIPMNP